MENICSHCGRAYEGRSIQLTRQTEVLHVVSSNAIETEVNDACVVEEYCETCGVEPALNYLRNMGLTPIIPTADPPVPLCCKCHGKYIRQDRDHVVYTIEKLQFDGEAMEVLDMFFCAPVCTTCEPVTLK